LCLRGRLSTTEAMPQPFYFVLGTRSH
jgi:hypothetical protein